MQTSDFIAIGAATISFFSLIYTIFNNRMERKYIKTQNELNALLLNKEKEALSKKVHAIVDAKFERMDSGRTIIHVFNKGAGKAHDVNIKFPEDCDWQIGDTIFPLEFLDSGQSVNLKVTLYGHSNRKTKCTITWEDDSGKNESDVILIN